MTTKQTTNNIDVEQLHCFMDDMRQSPEIGKYTFRAHNKWINGAHCQSSIQDFCAAGQEDHSRTKAHILQGDEPTTLLGENTGPNATETLLHALAACLNASFIYHAASQNIHVDQLEIEVQGQLDLNGFLGVNEMVPSNFQYIDVIFKVKADASEEKIRQLCEYAQKRSPVFNTVSNPISVGASLEIM